MNHHTIVENENQTAEHFTRSTVILTDSRENVTYTIDLNYMLLLVREHLSVTGRNTDELEDMAIAIHAALSS